MAYGYLNEFVAIGDHGGGGGGGILHKNPYISSVFLLKSLVLFQYTIGFPTMCAL